MVVASSDNNTQNSLWERISFLEKANQWYGFALDIAQEVSDLYGDNSQKREPLTLLRRTLDFLNRIVDLDATAFLLVREKDAVFEMVLCEPNSQHTDLQQHIDHLIESGKFAWAINQNRVTITEAANSGKTLLLNVLATRNRVRGMFIGIPSRPDVLNDATCKLISIVLNCCAYTLESASLYTLIKEQNQNLETTIEARNIEIAYRHSHDVITGLTNQKVFLDNMDMMIRVAGDKQQKIAIINLNLGMFKRVNDSFGYSFGDDLLRAVGQKLSSLLYSTQTCDKLGISKNNILLSRLRGDEFGIMFIGVESMDALLLTVDQLIKSFDECFKIHGEELYLPVRAGVSLYPEDGANVDQLLRHAHIALSHAKERGLKRCNFFDENMNRRSARRLNVERRLRDAMQQNTLEIHYQPKFHMKSRKMSGMEALLRMPDAMSGTAIPPSEFVPIAESTGLIIPLGLWVLHGVCTQIKQWLQSGHIVPPVSVNLSPYQLEQEDLAKKFIEIVSSYQLPPSLIELELTETDTLLELDHAASNLNTLSQNGYAITVDDFGTGYSSLLLLKHLPIQILKIDQSFVRDINNESGDKAIVTAVIAMAKSLNLRVIAEGVENKEQLSALKRLGCDEIQGFYLARPMPANQLEVLFRQS
ncbi:MAG TPA: bifunctional diguanylate cyclase/phosphodiesterase [Acidiferrobacteraceae bacterium]|nr:bifunctional diguanylate cyclase/phosphodiesterase [Acidiferrobacteraceae bacterium]